MWEAASEEESTLSCKTQQWPSGTGSECAPASSSLAFGPGKLSRCRSNYVCSIRTHESVRSTPFLTKPDELSQQQSDQGGLQQATQGRHFYFFVSLCCCPRKRTSIISSTGVSSLQTRSACLFFSDFPLFQLDRCGGVAVGSLLNQRTVFRRKTIAFKRQLNFWLGLRETMVSDKTLTKQSFIGWGLKFSVGLFGLRNSGMAIETFLCWF